MSGDAIQVLPARRRHLGRILQIERASFGRDAFPRQRFLELLDDCGRLFFIAKCSGRIAGYIVTCIASGRPEVVSVGVDPRCRKSGIGRALMWHTLRQLRRAGAAEVSLMVKSTNNSAVNFYSRFGFVRVLRVPAYYEDGSDGWLMRLRLGGVR